MILRLNLAALFAIATVARLGLAQARVEASEPIGVWRGTSRCRVRPSSCNDELVVYRIARGRPSDSLSVDAFKIVNGREEGMGLLLCRLARPAGSIVCAIPNGVWHFTPRADTLVGELRLRDNTKFRDVRATRSR
jgi:hypothetical protein